MAIAEHEVAERFSVRLDRRVEIEVIEAEIEAEARKAGASG